MSLFCIFEHIIVICPLYRFTNTLYLSKTTRETASKCENDARKLKSERNSLKNKAEALSKEMLKIKKSQVETKEIDKLKTEIKALKRENGEVVDKMKKENRDLLTQLEVATTETRKALDELETTREAHQQSVSYQLNASIDGNNDMFSDERINELECIITSLTEHLNAKEMQIETMKQVNEALDNELKEQSKPK